VSLRRAGVRFELPTFPLTGPVVVQLTNGSVCWEATYSPPFSKNDGASFLDKAD
jgi:hypothetical protein